MSGLTEHPLWLIIGFGNLVALTRAIDWSDVSSLISIGATVLLPLIPASIFYKLCEQKTVMTGPFKGLRLDLSGAFAGYFLVLVTVVWFLSPRHEVSAVVTATPPPEDIPIPEPPPPPEIQPEFVEERTPPPRQQFVEKIPPFPWPPPPASAVQVLPRKLIVEDKESVRLEDVNASLDSALEQCGYSDRTYYSVPDGFAIASRVEQINEDGTPSSDRWSLDLSYMKKVSIKAYLRALFEAPVGHYRVIVFVVTPHPFSQRKAEISASEAWALVTQGADTLPEAIGKREYSSKYKCTALIYEFKGTGHKAKFVRPSEIPSQMHLQNAGLLAALSQPK